MSRDPNTPARRIVSIAAAQPGWFANYLGPYPDAEEPWSTPVAAWVLLEDAEGQAVVTGAAPGADGDAEQFLPCGGDDFLGYSYSPTAVTS